MAVPGGPAQDARASEVRFARHRLEVAPTSMPAGRNSFADMAARERAMHFVAANGLHKNPPDLAEFQQFFFSSD